MMKKNLKVVLAVAIVLVMATGAMAIGPGGGMGMGMANCPNVGANLTPEQTQKFAQFQKETLPLRQQMLQLKTEMMTLRAQPSPDWKAIAEKQKQMVDVRIEIQKKKAEAGLTGFGPGLCGGAGMGMRGMGMRGMGMCGM